MPIKIRPRKTIEDYLRLPENARAELIEGELFTSPSPKFRHQRIVSNLHFALRTFVEKHSLGIIVDSPMDVYLPTGEIFQPDVIFVATANQGIVKDWIRGVPDLAIEVISPESRERDRIVKRACYEANGVGEYWLVDDETSSIEVLTLSGDRFAPHGYFEESDTVTSGLLAGLTLPAKDILA
jgi:Uma2 family endonuclease